MNLYFDNGTTSHPKPPEVLKAATDFINHGGGYGRSASRRTVENIYMVEGCREAIATILGAKSGDNIVFTSGGTLSLNIIIQNICFENKKVIVSPLEHNAVMRPLWNIYKDRPYDIVIAAHNSDGSINIEGLKAQLNDDIAAIIINHESNLSGVIQPLQQIGKIKGDIPLIVDGCQSAGSSIVNVNDWDIDFFAFTAHKSLYGMAGLGGIYAKNISTLKPLIYGGTGSNSESYEMPRFLPDKLEAGTQNLLGVATLKAGIENRPKAQHTHKEFEDMLNRIANINGIKVLCANDRSMQAELFSIVHEKLDPSEISDVLYNSWGIEHRKGLLCAPLANKTLGTFPMGVVRFALSPYHNKEDLDYLVNALTDICKEN